MSSQQPRWMILDFFAAFVRPLDNEIAISHLVQLMNDIGMDDQTVRSSVSRLKRRGWLNAATVRGLAGYRISEQAQRQLRESDSRVFRSEPASLADGWCIVSFSIPEPMARKRHELRSKLVWWGFGNPTPGFWIAPHRSHEYAERVIRDLGLESHAAVFGGTYLGPEELNTFVSKAWDFDRLSARYVNFIELHRGVRRRWMDRRRSGTDREAFVDYLNTLNAWRSIPFLDPGLPPELLDGDWRGWEAIELFHDISDQLQHRALEHVFSAVGVDLAPEARVGLQSPASPTLV